MTMEQAMAREEDLEGRFLASYSWLATADRRQQAGEMDTR